MAPAGTVYVSQLIILICFSKMPTVKEIFFSVSKNVLKYF